MKIVKFVNYTNEDFTGMWNGQKKLVKAGQSLYMADYLAAHFAKHLVNRELTKAGLHNFTSPKKPEEVPQFMELFNKAVILDEHQDDMGDMDIMDVKPVSKHVEQPKAGPAIVLGAAEPDGDDVPEVKEKTDDDDFEKKDPEVKVEDKPKQE